MAQINTFGEIVNSATIRNKELPSQQYKYESECLALAINYLEDEVVIVGYYKGAGSNNRNVMIFKAQLTDSPGSNIFNY
jgi:hypothetical protein